MAKKTKKLQKLSELINGKTKYSFHDQNINNWMYVIQYNNRDYLVVRVGKCQPSKCGAACCKFISDSKPPEFWKNFGVIKNNCLKIPVKCKHLKNNRCSIWKTKKFPTACQQYPHPTDSHYWFIANKCTFSFKLLGEIKRFK